MDEYVVLECSDTFEFYHWARAFNVWIPLRKKTVYIGANKMPVEQDCAAMTGYAFVPTDVWPELRRRCPEQYRVRALDHDLLQRPRTVAATELELMQRCINEGIPRGDVFTIGAVVRILAGPYRDQFAEIVKMRGEYARVLLGTRYISLPLALFRLNSA